MNYEYEITDPRDGEYFSFATMEELHAEILKRNLAGAVMTFRIVSTRLPKIQFAEVDNETQ